MSASAHDLNDIAALKARYCALADLCAQDPTRAKSLFTEIFTEDVAGDYGMGLLRGPAIAEFLSTVIAQNSEWMWHSISSPRISCDGERARAAWTVMVQSKRHGGEVPEAVLGRYVDLFVKSPMGWRISAVKFRRAGEEIDL